MKVTSETVATREVLLTIEPDVEAVQKGLRKAAQQISQWRPIPGFRPGKAPYAMVERIFGHDAILEQAVNTMAPDLYRQAIKEADLEPYEQGELDIASKDPLTLKIRIPLVPVVTLGDYQALHVDPEPEVTVSEQQIDEQLANVRRAHAQVETVERAAQSGDQLIASVKGVSEGETLLEQEETTVTLDDQLPPPGFAEALSGMTAGDTREFSLTYPEDYDDTKLAGKNVTFTVVAKTVREVKLPEVNDDLAKQAGDYENLAALRDALATNLKARLESAAREREANAAIEALVAASKAEYPEEALKHEVASELDNRKARVQQVGFEWSKYLQMVGQTEEQMSDQVKPEMEKRLVRRLVLTEYARAAKLTVDEKELTQYVANMASAYGNRAEQFLAQVRSQGAMLSIYADLLTRKAVQHLTEALTGREAAQAASAEATTEAAASTPAEAPAAPEEPQA